MASASFRAGMVGLDIPGLFNVVQELKTVRGRLSREMAVATKTSAQKVTADARSKIIAQTTGKTTGKYPGSITWEFKSRSATGMHAVVGPEVNPRNPKQAIQLEYGNSHQAPKPHLNPALFAEHDDYAQLMSNAAYRAVFP